MNTAQTAHEVEYGIAPKMLATAPGRVHLFGDHSWFFKDKTLSVAVNLPVYVSISLREDLALRFYFHQLKERKRANIATLKFRKEDRWANSVKAIIYAFVELGYECQGMDISIHSEMLPSAGFGINTAVKIASALAINAVFGFKCTTKKLLSIIELANHEFLQAENYIADIFASLYAKKDFCVLSDHEAETYEYIPFKLDNTALILTDARVPRIPVWDEETIRTVENRNLLKQLKRHRHGKIEYEELYSEIDEVLNPVSEEMRRRLLCLMKEQHYLNDAIIALTNADRSLFAKAVNRSHEGLRSLYDITCPEIDWLIKRVQEFEQFPCARISGKGFGRCTYTIISQEDTNVYAQRLTEYERIFGFHPVMYEVTSAAGATVL